MITIPEAIIAAVAAQRLIELTWAQRNTKRLKAKGAKEFGAGHYPLIVLLHLSWLGAMLRYLPDSAVVFAAPLVLFVLLQFCRIWVLLTLGDHFTTRIITLPGAPLVRTGPYRFVRHPNYLIVAGEILLLPLVFGEPRIAILFSLLNGGLLAWRIRVEDYALDARRKQDAIL